MAESRQQWHLACRHFRHNISNIWIYLGLRLDFRLRVYMLKESLRVLCNFLDINICIWYILFVIVSTFLDFLVSTVDFFSRLDLDFISRLSTLDFQQPFGYTQFDIN